MRAAPGGTLRGAAAKLPPFCLGHTAAALLPHSKALRAHSTLPVATRIVGAFRRCRRVDIATLRAVRDARI